MLVTWLSHLIGVDNPSGRWELFWSGFGSDIAEFGLLGALVAGLRSRNCHIHRCWRFGHHEVVVDGVTYKVCRKHHPSPTPRRLRPHHLTGGDS